MKNEKLKAYEIYTNDGDEGVAIVWAKTPGKAKNIALYYDSYDMCEYTELRAKRFPQFDKYAESKKIPIKELLAVGWWFYCDNCGRPNITEDDVNDGNAFIIDRENDNEVLGGVICAECKKKLEVKGQLW